MKPDLTKVKHLFKFRVAIFISLVIVVLLLIFFFMALFEKITIDIMGTFVQIGAICIALLIPFVSAERGKNKTRKEQQEIYAKCFDYIGFFLMYIFKLKVEEIHREDFNKKMFLFYSVLKFNKKYLYKIKIIFNESSDIKKISRGGLQSEVRDNYISIIFEESGLEINFLIYGTRTTVQKPNISILGNELFKRKDVDNIELINKKKEIFEIFEKVRRKNLLFWNNEIKRYFSV